MGTLPQDPGQLRALQRLLRQSWSRVRARTMKRSSGVMPQYRGCTASRSRAANTRCSPARSRTHATESATEALAAQHVITSVNLWTLTSVRSSGGGGSRP